MDARGAGSPTDDHWTIRMHSSPFRAARRSLLALALIGAIAGCASDTKTADSTTTAKPTTTTARATTTTSKPTTTTEAPTTTEVATTTTSTTVAETTTTAAETTTTVAETTTTLPPVPVYPLTGVVVDDAGSAARPALVVKIDNANGARPQSGFNEADMVFEEIVNDHITRFAMVFQSGGADPVGPIRSGRIQDIDLFTALNHPLFAWSGGNRTVTNAIDASELINIGPAKANLYFRTKDKKAPHNLYSTTERLYTKAAPDASPPPQWFQYRAPDAPPAGTPADGVAISLDSIDVRWDWDPSEGLFRRRMEGRVHEDALSGQITTNNVVILNMEYLPGISDSPDAQTIGTGEAFVMTGGNYIHGTWERDDAHQPFKLTADDGTPILLQPGRTFIELPRVGHVLVIPPGAG
jgi:hypothetical protein